jgi:hypothetical protein
MKLGVIVGVVVAMAVGFGAYAWQAGRLGGKAGAGSPSAIVDTVAVKTDLLMMANAQRQQFALEGRYVPLDDLRKRGVPLPVGRGPFAYSAEVSDMSFTIKATYHAKDGEAAPPPLTIGPDMLVK